MEPVSENAKPIIRPLSPGLQKIAAAELNEVQERVEMYVLELRKWVHSQPHLRARTNDQFLLAFLRGSKYCVERAKQKLDAYYTMQSTLPEIYDNRRRVDHPMVIDIIRSGALLRLKNGEGDTGPGAVIIRAGGYDLDKFKFADIIRVSSMYAEIMFIEEDNANVCGFLDIMDMKNVSLAHLLAIQTDLVRRLSAFSEEAMPTRMRGTHFINVPPPFVTAFNALKSVFPAKMKSRVTVTCEPESIFELVPRENLPEEYGGTNGTMQDILDRMEAQMLRYRDYFAQEPNYGANEKLRIEPLPIKYNSYMGAEGSFRKLDID